MKCALLFVLASALPAADLDRLLKGVEERYNRARTLHVRFWQTYSQSGTGAVRRTESGALALRKPGRMRWDYDAPAGKLLLSDGKFLYYYSPETQRAEKSRLKESEDMRAPLAFLLGRLEFRRDFGRFEVAPEGPDRRVRATPKSDKMAYREVEFLVTPQYRIRHLIVRGQDQSVLEFRFEDEKLNPSMDDGVFRFRVPAGAEFIDLSAEP